MKATYLLPLWVDIKCDDPMGALRDFNSLLGRSLEDVVFKVSKERSAEIEVGWSINQNIKTRED